MTGGLGEQTIEEGMIAICSVRSRFSDADREGRKDDGS
jgi:hypothetical protein